MALRESYVFDSAKLIQLQNKIKRDRDVGRNPIFDAAGNRCIRGEICEVGYGSATKLTGSHPIHNGERLD